MPDPVRRRNDGSRRHAGNCGCLEVHAQSVYGVAMRWVWVLALNACATATLDATDSGSVAEPDAARAPVDAAPPTPDSAVPLPDAVPPPPDATPLPDAVPLSTCEAADLMPDNDDCANAIDLTGSVGAGGAVVHGNTDSYVDTLEPPTSCTSGWGEDGRDAIYRVDAAVGQTITAVVTPEGYDAAIYILVDCNNPDTCVAGLDTGGDDDSETIEHTAVADTSYYVAVDAWRDSEHGCFTLRVTVD